MIVELTPTNGRKSFGRKALIDTNSNTLLSYNTPIMRKLGDGRYVRLCNDSALSQTTCTHIKAFSGLNKQQFMELPYE